MRRAFSREKLDSSTRVPEGLTGREEMREAREMDKLDGDWGGGTGSRVNIASIRGSLGTEVMMFSYRSQSAKDSDW